MPSTYTVNLGIEKPATGEQSGTWGDTTNVNFDILDQAINGAARVTLTSAGSSGSPNALQITNGATSDGRNKWVEFYSSGDLGGSVYVQLDPNDAEKIVFVRNSLAGSRSILLFQGTYNSGRDLEVPAGVDMVVKFDGGGASAATVTDVYTKLRATEITTPTLTAGTADINGGTLDGSVIGGASAAAITGTTVTANTSLNIAGDGATVTGIKDEDNMASNSATKLATQQSIKAYVDSQVGTVDTWAEVLANGATSGSTNPEVTAGQALKTNTINETSAGSGVTIDSVLLKDDVVNATDVETGSISANDGTASATIADTTGNFTITNLISNSVDIGGGAIDGTTVGGATPASGSFTALTVDTMTLNASSITGTSNLTLDIAGDITLDAGGSNVFFKKAGTSFYSINEVNGNAYVGTAQSDKDLYIRGNDGGTEITALLLDMSAAGAATFNNKVTAIQYDISSASYDNRQVGVDGQGFFVYNTADNRYDLQINDVGAVSVGGVVTANAGVVVDNITIDGTTIALSSGDLTLDVAGDIILDADGGDVFLRDAGSEFGRFQGSNQDLLIRNDTQDKDISFVGNDGGVTTTALTLDMSSAGAATFNNSVLLSGTGGLTTTGGNNLTISGTVADHAGLVFATHSVLPAEVGVVASGNIIDLGQNGNEFKTLYLDTSIITSNELTIATGTNLVIDAADEIILDSDDGIIRVRDAGGDFGMFQISSNDFIVRSMVSDADLLFKGNDGGSTITALTLDMSAGGTANFGNGLNILDDDVLALGNTTDFKLYHNSSASINYIDSSAVANTPLYFYGNDGGSGVNGLILDFANAGRATFNSNVLGTIVNAGAFSSGSIGGSMADANVAEMGPGYLNLARDDTADAKQLSFYKNGVIHSFIETKASALVITSRISNADILITGNDGGSDTTFLTFDSSEAGNATFNRKVGIGAAPAYPLHLYVSESANTDLDTTFIYLQNPSDGGAAIEFVNGVAAKGKIAFAVDGTGSATDETDFIISTSTANGGALTDRLLIDTYGNFIIKTIGGSTTAIFGGTNLVNGVTGVPSNAGTPFVVGRDTGTNRSMHIAGFLNIDNGYGVGFGASAGSNATSTVLDDYEEGTWAPTFSEQSAGTGTYTKIGRNVQVWGEVVCDANGAGVNPLTLSGLPFSVTTDTYRIHLGFDSMNTSASGNNTPTPFNGMMLMQHDQYVRPSSTGSNPYFKTNLLQIGTRVYISGQFETIQ